MSPPEQPGAGRRRAYRVRPESLDELELALLEKRYRLVSGAVGDVAYGGVSVRFDPERSPAVTPGDAALLAVVSDTHDFDATLHATVVAVLADTEGCMVRFEFEREADELPSEKREIFCLFNRRASWRRAVSAGGRASIRPAAAPGDDSAVQLRDLSAAGLGFEFDPERVPWLDVGERLNVALRVPGTADDASLSCRVVRRSPEPATAGCEILWDETPAAARASAALAAFVSRALAEDPRPSPDRRAAPRRDRG